MPQTGSKKVKQEQRSIWMLDGLVAFFRTTVDGGARAVASIIDGGKDTQTSRDMAWTSSVRASSPSCASASASPDKSASRCSVNSGSLPPPTTVSTSMPAAGGTVMKSHRAASNPRPCIRGRRGEDWAKGHRKSPSKSSVRVRWRDLEPAVAANPATVFGGLFQLPGMREEVSSEPLKTGPDMREELSSSKHKENQQKRSARKQDKPAFSSTPRARTPHDLMRAMFVQKPLT